MFLVKKIRPLTNYADFVSGRFLAEKTYLVGYWNLRMLRKDQVRNRYNLLVMVIISLRRFSSNLTAVDQTKVTASPS
jgi:hypothetical protein